MVEFDIIDAADQQFATIMNGRRVTIRLRYNVSTDRWNMDLSIDDLPVLTGRRIVTGIDLIAPFGFEVGVIFAAPEKPSFAPDRDSLPRGLVRLYHATDEEIAELI